MSYSILIKKIGEPGFTDRTLDIQGLEITQGTTKEATTGSFNVDQFGTKYVPGGEDEVQVFDGATKIFGGFVIRVGKKRDRAGMIRYSCDLKNKVHRLDYKLVNKTYSAMTAYAIILDIVSNFSGPGITTANVENDLTAIVTKMTFGNIPPSEAIQQLAETFGKEWYVDVEGDIHFFSKFSELAPFPLDDTNGKYVFDSLDIQLDYTQIKNSILVDAGEELSTTDGTQTIKVVGNAKSFPLAKKFASGFTVTVNGTPVTVGAAYLDSFPAYQALYDYGAQSITFDTTVVADTDVIVITGKYYFPIAVRYNDSASIAIYGRREFLIQEKSIRTRTDAILRAQAELAAYSGPLMTASFETNESGLQAGQKITIDSPLRGVTADFVIQRIGISPETPTKLLWRVELVSVKNFELIDLLAQIIKGRRIEQAEGTVIANAERLDRTIAVQRSYLTYVNSLPIWVTGFYYPTPFGTDRKRTMFADRGAKTT